MATTTWNELSDGASSNPDSRSYSRRRFLKSLGAGAAAASVLPRRSQAQGDLLAQSRPAGPRNVLFIQVDDLRPQLNCYGHKQMHTPSIDRLAGEGVLFKRAYCQVPVCGASRASLLSGIRPEPDRFINYDASVDQDAPGVLTLPQHFKANGYETVSLGKVYHKAKDDLAGWSQTPWRPSMPLYLLEESMALRQRRIEEREAAGAKVQPWEGGPPVECADVPDNAYIDGAIADRAVGELRRLRDSPFFLAVGFNKPHLPFSAPRKYWDLYKRESIDLADNPFAPKDAPRSAMHNWGELRQFAGIPAEGPLSDDQARELIHGYYACVSYTDAQIGRVLDELKEFGLDGNTVVVLCCDHGWQLGEHGLWCKHCNFENCVHGPLIVRDPAIPGGAQADGLVEHLDIYPSLCELCGLEQPVHLEGESFVPLLKDPARGGKKAVFSRYITADSVKTDRYRYTQWTRKGEDEPFEWMLYDHEKDPQENVNIADLEENRELVEEMRTMLASGGRDAGV